jgi:hypothetical protein
MRQQVSMDRIASLIQEIQHAHQQGEDADVLLSLVQQLQTQLYQQTKPVPNTSKWVAVIMPTPVMLSEIRAAQDVPIKEEADTVEEGKIIEVLQVDEEALEAELKQIQEKAAFANQVHVKQAKSTPGLLFDMEDDLAELPTFVHQPGSQAALQQTASNSETHDISLNDQLSNRSKEVADQLGGAPIKDLRKGVGINDRFLFINELFRGDESMYERSIKTINNFTIYAEAQYWMERELKVKLGWDNEKSVTQDFYALVRRRFA